MIRILCNILHSLLFFEFFLFIYLFLRVLSVLFYFILSIFVIMYDIVNSMSVLCSLCIILFYQMYLTKCNIFNKFVFQYRC
jgi:hypothetical protein